MTIKLHPLHRPEWVAQYILSCGEYPGNRCTGRTTAHALSMIAEAMRSPGKSLPLQDHYGTKDADRVLATLCKNIVRKLEMEHFTFVDNTIQFG